ncbi:nuclear transport factor 2 family protein [Promicromonospora sp. NPDC050249]|uniref:nuclear transport factor 2 family protein n=1 Tax=Promicromonospora sp. NPDC050249 TaxID=3154743 RepID=UPI0033ECB630
MSAREVMERLADVIDGHRWEELPTLLDPAFTCRYVHTGETFDADSWVRLNADYPGFQNFRLEDCVADQERAAGRAHVTGMADGEQQHFEVATFITVRGGLIVDMTEVWTDVDQAPPTGTRLA